MTDKQTYSGPSSHQSEWTTDKQTYSGPSCHQSEWTTDKQTYSGPSSHQSEWTTDKQTYSGRQSEQQTSRLTVAIRVNNRQADLQWTFCDVWIPWRGPPQSVKNTSACVGSWNPATCPISLSVHCTTTQNTSTFINHLAYSQVITSKLKFTITSIHVTHFKHINM